MAASSGPPNHPETFGEELRRLRESAGLSLDDIAAETKISKRILRAMEDGKFQYLPERVFSRNFVLQYARTIGFDEQRLGDWFDEAWARFELKSGSHPALQVAETVAPRSIRWNVVIPAVLALLVLAIVTYLIGRTLSRSRSELEAVTISATPTATPTRVPPPSPTAPLPALVQEDSAEEPEAVELRFAVRIPEGAECWIRYRDGQGRSEQKLLFGGERLELTLPPPVRLTVGNAGAAVVEMGDRSWDRLGRLGRVAHFELTHEGLREIRAGNGND